MNRNNINRANEICTELVDLEEQKEVLSASEVALTTSSVSAKTLHRRKDFYLSLLDVPLFCYNYVVAIDARIEELEAELSEL